MKDDDNKLADLKLEEFISLLDDESSQVSAGDINHNFSIKFKIMYMQMFIIVASSFMSKGLTLHTVLSEITMNRNRIPLSCHIWTMHSLGMIASEVPWLAAWGGGLMKYILSQDMKCQSEVVEAIRRSWPESLWNEHVELLSDGTT
jgi:hypothetical protein